MSIPDPANLRPHDLAKVEIDAWRGRCLNVFARAERAVTETVLLLREGDTKILLEPLAGQRFSALEKLAPIVPGTEAQEKGLQSALLAWRDLDTKRPFFSHGVVTELVGRTGQWHVQLDFLAVRKGQCEAKRLNWSGEEAAAFEVKLHAAFKGLTNQLGQLRRRISPQPQAPANIAPKKPNPGSSPG